MRKIDLPFGKDTITAEIPRSVLRAVLRPGKQERTTRSEQEIVAAALSHPIGTKPLHQLAKDKHNVVIITSDHTRAVPSRITMPLLLEEIRNGNPEANITILVATGLHRSMTQQEMRERFGDDICDCQNIVNHNAYDQDGFVDLGILPSGSKCEINTMAVEADLLIAEGFIEPHFFAGYSGGRKSVLPGIASQDCVNINHSADAMKHPGAATGVLDGNPIHEDMIRAAKMANLAFILNVLLDDDKRVIEAYSGDVDLSHRKGTDSLMARCGVETVKADIVIATNGGYPLDQNLYQCPKGLDAAIACSNEGAVIILVAQCSDGLGGENFGELMMSGPPHEILAKILATPPTQTISEQWCVQRFAYALCKHPIILVTDGLEKEIVERMNFISAGSIKDALHKARLLKGQEAGITVIPDGVGVIVRRGEP